MTVVVFTVLLTRTDTSTAWNRVPRDGNVEMTGERNGESMSDWALRKRRRGSSSRVLNVTFAAVGGSLTALTKAVMEPMKTSLLRRTVKLNGTGPLKEGGGM